MTCASRAAVCLYRRPSTARYGARRAPSRACNKAASPRRHALTCPADLRFPASTPGGPTTAGWYPKRLTNINIVRMKSTVRLTQDRCCRCGEGRVLGRSRMACEDEDECAWRPCLSGGSCFNTQPGEARCVARQVKTFIMLVSVPIIIPTHHVTATCHWAKDLSNIIQEIINLESVERFYRFSFVSYFETQTITIVNLLAPLPQTHSEGVH